MKLSFVIVNYQSEKYLAKCLSSIREKVSGVDYEIIVINNDKILEAKLPSGVKCINTGKNVGYGAGCNTGAKIANGEILCFLNSDTEIISENIKSLSDEFERDDKLAIVGPRLVDGGEPSSSDEELGSWKTQSWCSGREVTVWSIILNNLGYKRDKKIWESEIPVECAWVSGAAMFIKQNVFQKLGGFDEKFFMYFEDIDLCKRARKLGYKVLYFPEFTIKHFGGKSFLDKKEQKKYYRKSQSRYFKKFFLQTLKTYVKGERSCPM